MAGRLNTFQKAMLQWNDIHPYNAVHIVRVMQYLDRAHLTNAINAEIGDLGLGGFSINRRKGTYTFTGGHEGIELRFVDAGADIASVLSHEAEAELNRPFPVNAPSPFRFFAVDCPDSFYFGLVYFHAIAGAESIALLLQCLVQRYRERGRRPYSLPLDLYPKPSNVKPFIRPSLLAGQFRQMLRQIENLRGSCRPRYHKTEDHKNAFKTFVIRQEQFQKIVATAKRWGVTLNDFFLAVILRSVSPLAEARFRAPRRRQISAASIANIRKDLKVDVSRTFGLFLGSFSVSHEVPEGISLESLARDLQRQTDLVKKYKTYLLSPLELKAAEFLVRMLGSGRRSRFYTRNYPLWAGITNMNLNTIWPQGQGDGPGDYLRGVSTGPITPCVFAITTVGEKVNVGVSYRTAVFRPEDMEGIVNRFIHAIEGPEVRL
ncbi:MAG: hypothetical protein HZA15_09800 [Nitrospirae bacterium]|nr:hypothetical protein [Nitrospirota bacterium]